MPPTSLITPCFLVTSICFALCAAAGAQMFSVDFESFTAPAGNFNGGPSGQVGTGLDLAHSGSLTGWSKSGDLRSWTDATTEHIGSESDGEITTITVRIPAPEAGVPIRRFARVAARPKSL